MEIARKGDILMLRLDHGEDILASVLKGVEGERSTLLITTGLGMIHDFELGYFDNGNYIKARFKESFELLSMQGSVASDGEPRIHIHVTVADKEHRAFGGHLMAGKAWMSNEIGMIRIAGHRSRREFNPEKNVGILHI
jgi:predicted DNA-binding protein with PD1-like motif